MENYDYAVDTTHSMNMGAMEHDTHYDIPEPIDQWAVEDFEQFAALIIDSE